MGTDAWSAAVARLVRAVERVDARGVDALAAAIEAAIEAAPSSRGSRRRRRPDDVMVAYPELLAFASGRGVVPRLAAQLWNILVRESGMGSRSIEESQTLLPIGVVRKLATHDRSDFRNYGRELQNLHRAWIEIL